MFLSFKTMIDRKAAAAIDATIGFRIEEERYVATLRDGSIEIEPADPEGADVIFTARPEIMAAVIYGGQYMKAMESAGQLTVEGDRALAERFTTLFPLPDFE